MSTPEAPTSPRLRALLEYGPLAALLITYWQADLYWATGVFMVTITASLIASRVLERRWPVMMLFTAVLVLVLGGLTIALQDETFFKLKPTIAFALFALILLGGLAAGKALLRVPFGTAFQLDDEGWRRLTLRWALFFVFMAGFNEIVRRNASTSTWLTFKVFGVIGLTMAFMFSQMGLIKRHSIEPAIEPADEPTDDSPDADKASR